MRTNLRFLGAIVLLTGFSSCLSYRFTLSGDASPRDPNCSIKVLSTIPAGSQELGFFVRSEGTNSAETFLKYARAKICAAGGDAIAIELNGYGYINRAIVMRTH